MRTNVTARVLEDHAAKPPSEMTGEQAFDACRSLQGLARWWLRPRVLRKAHGFDPSVPAVTDPVPPALPVTAGSCWALFVRRSGRWPALRPAFVLPLQWRKGSHSPRLPRRLVRVAESVAHELHEGGWGLHPHDDAVPGALDLSELDAVIDPPSAWAAVGAGLVVATQGGRPDPAVWATGSWRPDDGVVRVGGLRAKVRLAAGYGAEVLYAPHEQAGDARRWADGTHLRIASLTQGTLDPRKALGEYAGRLDAPPPPPESTDDEAGFEAGIRYHDRQPRGAERTVHYYLGNLLPTIIERSRAKLARRLAGQGTAFAPTHLVTIFSGSPELAVLMPSVLPSVTDVLLLYTPDDRPASGGVKVSGVCEQLGTQGTRCRPGEFADDETQADAIPALVGRFLAGVPADRAVYDLTPGTGWMRWLADRAMPPGSWRVYLRHQSKTAGSRPRPGTEDPIPWRA